MKASATKNRKPITRPVVSELDGMQQGGLAFVVALLGGLVAAAILAPGSLTSFWIWFLVLMLAVAIGSATQKVFARIEEETE